MATFHAEKLASKKNRRFRAQQRAGLKTFRLSQKKSSDNLIADAQVSFQSESESETALSGKCVVEELSSVCFLFSRHNFFGIILFSYSLSLCFET